MGYMEQGFKVVYLGFEVWVPDRESFWGLQDSDGNATYKTTHLACGNKQSGFACLTCGVAASEKELKRFHNMVKLKRI